MRSKRLRKKLYVNEFAVYCFEFTANCSKQDDSETFIDDFLCLIESRGLIVGGAGELEHFEGFIVSA